MRPFLRPVLAALLVPALLGLAGCGGSEEAPTADGPCRYRADGQAARKVDRPDPKPDPRSPTRLTIATSAGDIPITLEPDSAPCAVNSFVSLAEQGYYDETPCHRVTTEGYYVLQCGDPTGTGLGGPGYAFDDELAPADPRLQPCEGTGATRFCTYGAGLIAMANSGPDTNGSQFFLVYGASAFAPAYTVIGEFGAAGLAVLNEIADRGVGTSNGQAPGDGAPKEPVTITSVR